MSLLQLLRVGRSFGEIRDEPTRYRMPSQPLLPRFNSGALPRCETAVRPVERLKGETPSLFERESVGPAVVMVRAHAIAPDKDPMEGRASAPAASTSFTHRSGPLARDGANARLLQLPAGLPPSIRVEAVVDSASPASLQARVDQRPLEIRGDAKDIPRVPAGRRTRDRAPLAPSVPRPLQPMTTKTNPSPVGRRRSWWARFFSPRNPFGLRKPGAESVGSVQGELRLDAVKPVCNDLAESDLEVVPLTAPVAITLPARSPVNGVARASRVWSWVTSGWSGGGRAGLDA